MVVPSEFSQPWPKAVWPVPPLATERVPVVSDKLIPRVEVATSVYPEPVPRRISPKLGVEVMPVPPRARARVPVTSDEARFTAEALIAPALALRMPESESMVRLPDIVTEPVTVALPSNLLFPSTSKILPIVVVD